MIIIKKMANILFFILTFLLIVFLLEKLGIINFCIGLLKLLLPILFGFFLSVVLEGIIEKFVDKGHKRKWIVIITYIGLLFSIALGIVIIFPSLTKQINIFITALPELISNIKEILKQYDFDISKMINMSDFKLNELANYVSEGITIIFNIGITLSSAFFISYDYPKIKRKVKEKIPNIIKDETIYFFSKYIPFFSKYIYSLLIDSLITFTISFILFLILGIDYSLIGALIITITNLIPYIGPIIGVVPLYVIGYSISSYAAITSLVVVLIVQLIESNLIQPLIFKNVIKIHPLEGIIGVLIFSYLLGVIGMIFSPLLVVAFKILFVDKYNKESQFEDASIQ